MFVPKINSIACCLLLCAGITSAQEAVQTLPSFEAATKEIQDSTVTIRITCSPTDERSDSLHDKAAKTTSKDDNADKSGNSDKLPAGLKSEEVAPESTDVSARQVLVFSGVCIGKGQIVTPLFLSPTENIRITVPGGKQCLGRTLVMDEYSGLSLLAIDSESLDSIEITDDLPSVGSFVLSGSGWGVNKPLVSFGIVSGFDHHLPNSNLPGLMACDVRTARTSKGAPIVDTRGRLRGIVIAMATGAEGGWTYAVPAKHVERLSRAYRENFLDMETGEEKKDVGVLVLPRKRPKIGFYLNDQGSGKIHVVRTDKDGPAELAGIKKGDQILRVEGTELRSVYQLIRPTLARQPGDLLRLTIRNVEGIVVEREVTLGGGSTFKAAELKDIGNYIVPQIVFTRNSEPELKLKLPVAKPITHNSDAVAKREKAVETVMSQLRDTRQRLVETKKESILTRRELEELQEEMSTIQKAIK